MVFESIVVDVLNRLLGDYFENLDTSQLRLGIWGGDVELKDLKLRASALDDLGPFKVVVGKLGNLTMKIPWTSLYTAPVILNLKDLHLLVMMSRSMKFDEANEEKAMLLAKDRALQRLEDARVKELSKKHGPAKIEEDTFTEKMVAQIIKNVQIKIDSIHIRYEDISSNPKRTFSCGVILKSLAIETTNKDWKPQIITETVHIIHKMANLDGLSVYWNSESVLLNDGGTAAQILNKMKEFISNDAGITYVLGPIVSEAKLKLVPNPERGEHPFSLPKMLMNVVMQELALGMTNSQFQDLMNLVEALDYMSKSKYYIKYRPSVEQHKGHSKEWWRFAYRCIVEEDVRRRRLNWDWNHMKQHRELCRAYANAYYEKKISKKVKHDIEAKVAQCEKILDIFNITLVREQVEVRLARRGSDVPPTEQKGGWLSWSGWFGGSQSSEAAAASTASAAGIAQKLEQALTPEEKKKLYQAIDYKEDDQPLEYPKDFEEYVLDFRLHRLKFNIKKESEDRSSIQTLELAIDDASTSVRTRPAKSGKPDGNDVLFQIDANLDQLTVQFASESINLIKAVLSKLDGKFERQVQKSNISLELRDLNVLNLAENAVYKHLVRVDADKVVYVHVVLNDEGATGDPYLDMDRYDMKVKVETGSPKIVYLGPVVSDILIFINSFQSAKDAVIEVGNAAVDLAQAKVENVYKDVTRIVLDVALQAPKIIIPRNEYTGEALMADLGNLTIQNTFKNSKVDGFSQLVITDEMHVHLNNVKLSRIIFDSLTGNTKSEVHILDPISVNVNIIRNLSSDWYKDLAVIKIDGTLKSCFVRMNNEDYSTILASLTENVAASGRLELKAQERESSKSSASTIKAPIRLQPLEQGKVLRSPARRASEVPRRGAGAAPLASSPGTSTSLAVPEEDSKPFLEFEVSVAMEKVALILYKGSSKLEEIVGMKERDLSLAFADFAIQNVQIELQQWNSGNMNVDITTQEITLEDCRPGEREVTNLIRRKHELDDLMGNAMIRVTYKSEGDNAKNGPTLVIDTTSLIIVLCLDYLLQLSGFFVIPSSTSTQAPPPKIEVVPEQKRRDSVLAREVRRIKAEEDVAPKVLVNSKIYFNMAETEVILVEDMGNINANALLLHCEITMKMISNEEKTNLMGTIGNLNVSTCNFDTQLKYEKLAEVISPMSITMVMNSSQEVGTLVDLNISNIFIRLNAGTLELLLKISTGVTQSSEATQEKAREVLNYKDHWNVKEIKEMNFWFLKPDVTLEVGTDIANLELDESQELTPVLFEVASDIGIRERLILESGSIIITFEAGGGASTMPLLLIESDVDLQMFDWSTKLQVAGRMKLEAAYYNTKYGLWEFLIEPIETRNYGKVSHQPWEMLFEYSTVPEQQKEKPVEVQPYMGITLQSNEILEMSLSKPALDVLTILSEEFQAAAKSLISDREVITAPYTIVNDLGTPIRLDLRNTAFACYKQGVTYDEAVLNHGTSVNLGLLDSFDMTKHYTSVLREQEGREERLLKLTIPEFEFDTEIPVNRAEKRFYPLHKKTEFGESFGILCDIAVKDCSKVLTLRGIVQIVNELPIAVDVFCMDEHDAVYKLMGTVEPKGLYNVPLTFLYTKTCEFYFAPRGHKIAAFPFTWTVLMREIRTVNYLMSEPVKTGQNLYMKVVGEVKQTLFESTNRKTLASKCCYLYLRPPLVISNLLPVPIGYFTDADGTVTVAKNGEQVAVTNIHVDDTEEFSLFIVIANYLEHNWQAQIKMTKSMEELTAWDFFSPDKQHSMSLGIHKELVQDNNLFLHVYCPYWMINRTGMDLYYKRDAKEDKPTVIHHQQSLEYPIMFSFKGKTFFSKKKAFVRFLGSDWSDKFSLDVAGSSGTVICKSSRQEFQVGLEIVLLSWGLTKTIIFSPRFYLINQCPYLVKVQETQKFKESNDANVIELPPKSCISFWPTLADPYLVASIDDTKEKTKLFKYEHAHHTLLQLLNKYGGLHVDVHVTETSTAITFTEFVSGHAPVLLVNATPDCGIEYIERGIPDGERFVLPGCCQYIAWEDPMGQRTLEWSPLSAGKKMSILDKLHSDGTGRFNWVDDRNNEKSYFWASFLDGLQRVLLFTDDEDLVLYLQAVKSSDQVLSEYVIMFHGLGLSLVDSDRGQEVFYMRIASSEITWQSAKPGKTKRFKPMTVTEIKGIEAAYQHYLNEKTISTNVKSHITLDSGLEVDFAISKILKPNVKDLRRVFQTGIWIHYKNFPHANHFHAKLYRIQIDDQLPDAVFSVILAPVAPPRRISETEEPIKPFAEVSVMQRITAHSSVTQYKYFKVLIQEFHIRGDVGFINAVVEVFGQSTAVKMEKMSEYYNKDFNEACTPVEEIFARQVVTQGQKHFYDFLHFSPLKIHLSFSMGSSTQLSNNFLNLLLQSVGVTVTEVQDVVFKLACLELQHEILSGEQLVNELISHYKAQAIKQLYVLVLGLDVIGNPYGLVLGVTEGVEAFFYEPIHGAIQGPGEFAEGLALGCKALVSNTIGGAAGALSRITGTVGKGVAALTLDDEYKQKRREMLTKRPHDVAEAFARSGKGLVMGFFDGVTGVVRQPVKGAQEDGVEGFFKGLGKGTVGLFVRPVSGIVDFTSGSLDALKRATAVTVDTHRLRPPRHIPLDSVIQPYIGHEAEGMQLLNDLEKGKYGSTDSYVAHALINPHGTHVLLLTNKRIFHLKRDEVFGGWTIIWTHLWEEIKIVTIVEKGLKFRLKAVEKKFKILRSKAAEKELIVLMYNADVCTWILSKIETSMKFETGIEASDNGGDILHTPSTSFEARLG